MKPQFIIITLLILIKVIGISTRSNAENYIPGYTCNNSNSLDARFILDEPHYNYPIYRCGQTLKFERI